MINILFVCTGNICRSPMAEGILRRRWKKAGRNGLNVSSMGTHGLDDSPPSEFSKLVCEENGIDISEHRSRQLVYDDLEAAHLIFVMERVHREFMSVFFPRLEEKVFLLGAWPEKETRKSNIADPMGGKINAYRKSFESISMHIDRILPLIAKYYA